MLWVLKINSRNTGSLSCNLSPGNLYFSQESQFFSWHYLCYLGRDCANTFHVCENSPCCSESDFTYPVSHWCNCFLQFSCTSYRTCAQRPSVSQRGDVNHCFLSEQTLCDFIFIYLLVFIFFNNRCCSFVITFQTPASYFPWGLTKFAIFYYSVSHPVH